ncbi:MAG: sulfur carrier protein ThiS [Candidatus Omnitrophica bacterium]|nr:sulfur carrier protein ThiS [Candidatus Omnitrophota bacterium]
MRVQVNGEPRELADGLTAAQLLETLRIVPERVVVELNLQILKRAQLAETRLKDGDQVEIVQFVGGGAR